ncbi:MAG: hypothetical protein IPJ94_16755 [Chloroflexi bacterium]|nr:hypothetical protein [Chloroflexota bacterium]
MGRTQRHLRHRRAKHRIYQPATTGNLITGNLGLNAAGTTAVGTTPNRRRHRASGRKPATPSSAPMADEQGDALEGNVISGSIH